MIKKTFTKKFKPAAIVLLKFALKELIVKNDQLDEITSFKDLYFTFSYYQILKKEYKKHEIKKFISVLSDEKLIIREDFNDYYFIDDQIYSSYKRIKVSYSKILTFFDLKASDINSTLIKNDKNNIVKSVSTKKIEKIETDLTSKDLKTFKNETFKSDFYKENVYNNNNTHHVKELNLVVQSFFKDKFNDIALDISESLVSEEKKSFLKVFTLYKNYFTNISKCPILSKSGRLYTKFNMVKREIRKNMKLNDVSFNEFDIQSSHFAIATSLFLDNKKELLKEALKKLEMTQFEDIIIDLFSTVDNNDFNIINNICNNESLKTNIAIELENTRTKGQRHTIKKDKTTDKFKTSLVKYLYNQSRAEGIQKWEKNGVEYKAFYKNNRLDNFFNENYLDFHLAINKINRNLGSSIFATILQQCESILIYNTTQLLFDQNVKQIFTIFDAIAVPEFISDNTIYSTFAESCEKYKVNLKIKKG